MEFENLLRLVEAVSKSEVTALSYEENGVKIQLKKKIKSVPESGVVISEIVEKNAQNQVSQKADSENNPDSAETDNCRVIRSPLVGTFYAAPSEDAEAFVRVGSTVKKGQTLGIVEAMKLMNEIESEFDGVVEEILVNNQDAVEYGQPLFRIR